MKKTSQKEHILCILHAKYVVTVSTWFMGTQLDRTETIKYRLSKAK